MTNLLDVLQEADLRIGFTQGFKSLASREILDRTTLQQRLLLCLYGLGTNAGLKRMVSGETALSYRELLYVRRRFMDLQDRTCDHTSFALSACQKRGYTRAVRCA
jgi:hypothetical protein